MTDRAVVFGIRCAAVAGVAIALAAVAFGVGMITIGPEDNGFRPVLVVLGFAVPITIYGIAIARYRLYDIDLVVSRTIVYGSLAAIITGFYVGVVVGVGRLIGGSSEPQTALAIPTTAAVAAVFHPLRRKLQRIADRVVHGKRATPHDVLSELARRIAANDDRLLELVAESMVEGTGATKAEIYVIVDGRPVRTVVRPTLATEQADEATTFAIEHDGIALGALALSVPRGQRFSEVDRVLAEQVASGMGLALANRVRTATLERRVVELRESRRRLVAVQDEVRRRLERDLHDGAQQQLVALRVKLGLAQSMADKDGAAKTAAMLRGLAGEADRAIDAVRDLARGVYPPLLEAEGLGPAVSAHARRSAVPVTVVANGLGRYHRDVETTINVCVVEALRNVEAHAGATRAIVAIAEDDGVISFQVRDDGSGFDVDSTPPGAGLTKLADRIDVVAGRLSVSSTLGGGTSVEGAIPLERDE